jgi:hypothetical protein
MYRLQGSDQKEDKANVWVLRRGISSEIYRRAIRWKSASISKEHVILPSGLNSKLSFPCCLLHVGILFGLLFSPKDGFDFQRTTGHYMPEDKTIYNHYCENLNTYKWISNSARRIFASTRYRRKDKQLCWHVGCVDWFEVAWSRFWCRIAVVGNDTEGSTM